MAPGRICPSAMSELRRTRYPGCRLARPRRVGHHPTPSRVQHVRDALHHLRADRIRTSDGDEGRRPPRRVRSRQTGVRPGQGADPPARSRPTRPTRPPNRSRPPSARAAYRRFHRETSARWPWTSCASSTRSPTSDSPASTRASRDSSSCASEVDSLLAEREEVEREVEAEAPRRRRRLARQALPQALDPSDSIPTH